MFYICSKHQLWTELCTAASSSAGTRACTFSVRSEFTRLNSLPSLQVRSQQVLLVRYPVQCAALPSCVLGRSALVPRLQLRLLPMLRREATDWLLVNRQRPPIVLSGSLC